MNPITDKKVWREMSINKYTYFLFGSLLGLVLGAIYYDKLGLDGTGGFLYFFIMGMVLFFSGPYAWYVCSQTVRQIEKDNAGNNDANPL